MSNTIEQRLAWMSRDGNLDIEDVDQAVQIALEDALITEEEANQLREALHNWRSALEPSAKRYLEQVLSGTGPKLVNRILLAAHPRGMARDLYYPRTG